MKANEAPKKMYRTTTYLDSDKGKTLWKKAPVAGAENIEYTRTDAFIDKAVGRLKHYLDNSVWIADDVGVREKEVIIEDFVKYMEGE